ncbi:DUF1656 domain-containing protein [Methylocapsa acidiphila]|uniref:DUF1656 domain-containing protein n=1 Tax=Methylocapsa acidiphila TaxID=133552 RepID=UPI0003FA9649|nr:DUF1656 domain-containing protein [Methylocapsa acidiphila]
MRFFEINLYGVYVAPIAPIMLAAWLLILPLRGIANRFGLLGRVWHPAFFEFAAYLIALSCLVLLVAHLGRYVGR